MGNRRWLLLVVAVAAVVLLVGRTATALIVDHAWYDAMGVPTLFWERVLDTVLLQGGAWIVGSLFAFANLHAVRRTILAVAVPSRVANIELTAMVPGRRLLSATIILALLVGAVLAIPLTNWETLALARHGIPFGEIEGIFDRDLGHYVYWLPFEETMYLWALVSVVALTAMVLVLYALTRSLRLEGRRIAASTHVRRHLSVLGALVLLLLAWSYRLDAFDLLRAGSGPDGLFLRVDHRVTLRMDAVLAYGSAMAALIILRTGWAGQLKAAFVTLTVILLAAMGLRHVVPAVAARGDTLGDPARRDADYVAARALFSRRAFDADAVRPLPRDSADRANRAAMLPLPTPTATLGARASLWDAVTLAEGLRPGGTLPVSSTRGDDWATTGSEPRPAATDASGYMAVAAPGWFLLDGRVTALRVERPVSGAGAWRLSLVDASRAVLSDSLVPVPGSVADGRYGDKAPLVAPGASGARLLDGATAAEVPGALLDTPLARLAHAWALRDLSLLGADSTAGSPLLVSHRDVRERVRRIAPVFEQSTTVHAIRDGNRLYWVLHLYSASARYPLSQRWQVGDGVYSYFKLAGTAIVDAGTGRVRVMPAEKPDALARTWMTRLPGLFSRRAELPPSLAVQLPPPTDGAELQVRTFARYGSRLEGPVLRHLPDSAFINGPAAPVMLEQEGGAVASWSVPLLDAREAVAGVVTVTGGAVPTTYWWTSSPAVPWPATLARMAAAVDSLRAHARADSGGAPGPTPATVPRGSARAESAGPVSRALLSRPEAMVTSRGVLYVQAAQGAGADGRLSMGAAVVSDGEQIGVGPTLADALASLGETVERPRHGGRTAMGVSTPETGAPSRWYDAMRQAMKQGDWSAFGAAFDSLGRALGRPPQ
ncbi:MAG: UPF0182 family protein [Gemmatimonas sp.]|uniref:UPF0182 family protein n=1 Tax=Gemmatimonas sp. TaxID=1962908 RepID=UPI00391D4FFD